MTDDESRAFDALHKLSDQAWREWDHKSKMEWRLSFGIWAALLAAATAVSKAQVQLPWPVGLTLGVAVAGIHYRWLVWIRRTLDYYRSEMRKSLTGMYKLVGLSETNRVRPKPLKHPSIQAQLSISFILVLILVLVSFRSSTAPYAGGRVDFRLFLEYLKVVLSPPPVIGVVVLVFIYAFRTQLSNLIDRIKQLNWPGGGAVFGSQRKKEQEELAPNPQALAPALSGEQVQLPQSVTLTPQQAQQVVRLVQSERTNAALWEYRYLNYYLARSTQAVLSWLAVSGQGLSLNYADSYLQTSIPDANERKAILGALQKHHLVTVTNDLIEVTPKGREYIQWRGPVPPIVSNREDR